ncbi:MAG: 3-hydroxybutyryl-CoA dehydrogenase [Solirubrobacteraceae bacterium]|jgi:3-hydroxybutyryl-CoA dehydrogenase|nr:3-hydroxybutyryl-CoA dehydrogenase [Solirubrobacteraceae bacterium]
MGATIETAGVIGAGFMGSGIAESVARAGVPVVLFEPEGAPLKRSKAGIDKSVARAVERGKLSEEDAEALRERITWTKDFDALGGADLVMEAIVEDAAVKGETFQRLDALVGENTILATNTSSIPIAQIASWTANPSRVVGLHYFSPVPVMKLVEVVVGLETDEKVVDAACDFARSIDKHPILTKDRSGFIVNMLLIPYLMAAVTMYSDGFASREDIDAGMVMGCGHPMGPLTLCDFIGLDVMFAIGQSLYDEFKRPEYAPPPLLKRMVMAGHHGRKSGRGFYEY